MAVIGNLAVAITATTGGLTSGLSRAGKMVGGFTGLLGKAAGAAAMIGLPLSAVAGIAKVVSTGVSFEKQMSNVRAITQASDTDFAMLDATAQRLGATTVFSASQAAEAMTELAKAGFGPNQILGAMPGLLSLAASGELEMAEAAGIAAATINQMGLKATDMNDVADKLSFVANNTATTVRDLGLAMQYAAPIAHTAGVSLDETTAILGKLSNVVGADKAGTALRQIFGDMIHPTEQAQSVMKKLGVSFVDTAGNLKTMPLIIDEMNAAMAGMSEGQKLSTMAKIFDIRGLTGFAPLLSAGGEALQELIDKTGQSAGFAERVAKDKLNNVAGAWTLLVSAAEGAAIAMFQQGQGGIKNFLLSIADGISNAIPIFTQLSSTVAAVFGFIGEVVSSTVQFWQSVFGGGIAITVANVVDGLIVMQFLFQNWQAVLTLAVSSVALQVVTFANQVVYFFGTVVPAIVSWSAEQFAKHWQDVLKFVLNGFVAFAADINNNMTDLLISIASGGTIKFEPKWTSLGEGFMSALAELPDIADREMGELEKSLSGTVADLGGKLGEDFAKFRDDKIKAAGGPLPNLGDALDKAPALAAPDFTGPGVNLDAKTPSSFVVEGARLGTKEAEQSILNAMNVKEDTELKRQLKILEQQLIEQKKQTSTLDAVNDALSGGGMFDVMNIS